MKKIVTTKYLTNSIPITARIDLQFQNKIDQDRTQNYIERIARYLTNHGNGLRLSGVTVKFDDLTKAQKLNVVGIYIGNILDGVAKAESQERLSVNANLVITEDLEK
jgi:hypothetical protein